MAARSARRVLGDYFTLQRGKTYKSRLLGMPGPVLLGLATIQRNGGFRRDSLQTYGGDSPHKLLVQPGELYLSLKDVTQSADLLGAVARLPADHAPGRLTQDTVKLEPNAPDVPLDYLYWVLRTPQYRSYCRSHATGTTNLGLARDDFLAFPAPEPSPSQLRIVSTLSAVEEKIELNRRLSETLEAIASALFKSWFVDFDPVRAKAEGRDPGLPAPLVDLFPARLVDSELGKIPEGWKVGSIYEVADVIYGAPFSSARFNSDKVGDPLIRIRDLPGEAPSVWTPEVHPNGYKVCPGDIVVGMDGEFRAYLWGGAEGWLNQRLCVFKPKPRSSAAFVRNAIIRPLAEVEATETATTVIHLGKADIDRFRPVLPSPSVASSFATFCQPWYDRIVNAKQETRRLTALRDLLLPTLISGKLRMKDAAKGDWKARA